MNQEVTAQLKYLRTSPRKLRLIVDLIRGKRVSRALENLAVLNKKQAHTMAKLVNSAIANATNNHSLKADDLVIKTITVDGGPVLKRFMPKAHGRATPVRERTSHVKLVLAAIPRKVKATKTKKQ
jgi:large subunit ribosomal protein L22